MSTRPPIVNLDDIKDVVISGPTDNQALIYNGSTSKWNNEPLPGGTLATLTDVVIVTPLDNQLLKYVTASNMWVNYGPVDFADLSGNIALTQMNNGSGATATTFWRGDGTWATSTSADPGTTGNVMTSNGTDWVSSPLPVSGKVSLTSTVDQTATTETVHLAYTVPANSVNVGTVFRIHASGNIDNGTSAITMTATSRWGGVGGVSLATGFVTTSTTANTNRPWIVDVTVTIRTIGATGTAVAEANVIERSTSTTGVEALHTTNSGTTAITIDTTANKDLVFTWTLSATTGAPHVRTISGFVEIIKP